MFKSSASSSVFSSSKLISPKDEKALVLFSLFSEQLRLLSLRGRGLFSNELNLPRSGMGSGGRRQDIE
uniref:Uncharacterized protein n=1 Tax=Lepeophtheirus salmonis TaxID=72036 RepID=A0A0K2TQN6_LEPSM